MKTDTQAQTLDDIELLPDAMGRTEQAIKRSFRTGRVSRAAVKKTLATKRSKA